MITLTSFYRGTLASLLALGLLGTQAFAGDLSALTLVAPASPGGGWDQTARAMQAALEAGEVVSDVQVQNVPGAGGTIGLAQFVANSAASTDTVLVSGLIMMGASSRTNRR